MAYKNDYILSLKPFLKGTLPENEKLQCDIVTGLLLVDASCNITAARQIIKDKKNIYAAAKYCVDTINRA